MAGIALANALVGCQTASPYSHVTLNRPLPEVVTAMQQAWSGIASASRQPGAPAQIITTNAITGDSYTLRIQDEFATHPSAYTEISAVNLGASSTELRVVSAVSLAPVWDGQGDRIGKISYLRWHRRSDMEAQKIEEITHSLK